ncbi:MAG: bis(5'-nucleosyl)-tetraphosphatase (symmetrical) ApaH, partial [Plesiomonas sp.]
AGISPDWDLGTATACAAEVEQVLRSPQYQAMLSMMYGNLPDKWSPDLQGDDRLRYIINAFTRMRFCYPDGRLEMHCKLPAEQAPAPLLPWYQLPNPLLANHRVVFGHWASLLGKTNQPAVYALDTGCVWGNHLTLLRWDDQRYFQQPRINR